MTRFPQNRVSLPDGLAFFTSPPHPCGYLEDREAITLFADPYAPMDIRAFSALTELGFRRSGPYVYRPRCNGCAACVSVRIPVSAFQPDRSQRRTWTKNADLTVEVREECGDGEYFDLYRRYMAARHAGGSMDVSDLRQYREFLESPWCDTRFVGFRAGEKLLSVAVIDYLDCGLSAVYTFFDPDERRRSLGTLAVLWQIEEARRLGLPHVYLGYWVEGCGKMAYKDRFRPFEYLTDGHWEQSK
jgi:arginyl-tRNA--protein-N-Asp/Glu arginylyltransferase